MRVSVVVVCETRMADSVSFGFFFSEGMTKLLGIEESEQAIVLTPFAGLRVMSANGRAEQIPSAHRKGD